MNAESIIRAARESRRGSLDEWNGKKVLADFGIVVPRSAVVTAPDQVAKAVVGLEPPFAVKVMSAEILHKSDAGGVALRLANSDAVREAISTISERPLIHEARVDGYLIEEMSAGGTELVIGAVRDLQFGLMLMVGLGGIFVEVLQDVAFRICPISCSEGFAMLDELAELLGGAVGGTRAVV
ncbi:MAG TPA: acetyl-CoA synthetase, partial [Candidatus Latescibacteria bacterium]|nr:acetyl-CoA synthetase [Candidatus Latescibacterota bacterium]